jgi:hypothetical protein
LLFLHQWIHTQASIEQGRSVSSSQGRCDHPVTELFAASQQFVFAPAKRCGRRVPKVFDVLPMPRSLSARRYLIEIKDTGGTVVVSAVARWNDKDKRRALAQIERLAPLPQVNVYTGPAPAPQSGYSRQRRSGTGRTDKET